MKRFFFIICVHVLFCTVADAQINMQDSTVQVMAYWNIGDKYDYSYHHKVYTVENGDTVVAREYTSPFSIEVVDSTANSYTLELRSQGSQYEVMDETTKMMSEIENPAGRNMLFRIKTNEYGTYQGIENMAQCMDTLNVVLEQMEETYRKKIRETMTEQQADEALGKMKQILQSMRSEQLLLAAVKPYLRLFSFHGYYYPIDMETSSNMKAETFYSPGAPIDYTSTVWTDGVDPETSYAYFGWENVYDSDQLIQAYLKYIGKTLLDGKELSDSPERPYVFVKDNTWIAVHTDTGITTRVSYVKESGQGKKQNIEEEEIEMLFDEDE
ncbi:hypothetical protein [Bacteroides sp. UBA939]|uniref:hypothetical protein n=1 Tax=Bacteroides sp. UBA939 TaxID=1946092 RepID=UPI0025BB078C|nr:hypothetical protein [Bacteroides sp. UBA939]